jgi:dephospho-CoA kinase
MTMTKKLILITGMSGSGKTTLANKFRARGVATVTMGDVIRGLAREKGLSPTPENLGRLAIEIRDEGGDPAVANLCVEKINDLPDDMVLVDGIRSIKEVEVFDDKFEVVLVAVFTSQKTRFARLSARGRSDDPKELTTFKNRDDRELSFSLSHAIALADFILRNDGSLEDFENEFENLLTLIGWF